jgi:hypothetical protein
MSRWRKKLTALRTESYFRERAALGDVDRALAILERAGAGIPPRKGDEIPQ